MKDLAVKHASTVLIIIIGSGALFVATFGEYALGVLGWAFSDEIGVGTSMIGVLTAVMFGTSGVVSFFISWIADRIAPPMLALLQIVLAAGAFALFAFVQSLTGLVIACVLIGAIMALTNPLSTRLVSFYLPPSKHAITITWHTLGPQLGALFAGVAFGGMAELFNWRHIIIALTVVFIIFGIYCFVALRHREFYRPFETDLPPAHEDEAVHHTGDSVEEETKTQAIVWWLIPFNFFSGGAISSIGAFIPLYAKETMGLSIALAGVAGAVIAGVCIVARFLWAASLKRLDFVTVLVLGTASAAFSTVLLALSPQLGLPMFWLAIVLTGATAMGFNPVTQIVMVGATNRKQMGFIAALNGAGLYAGFTAQPLLIAFLIDRIGFDLSWYAMAISALISTVIMVIYAMVYGWPKGPYNTNGSASTKRSAAIGSK